jgi:hypothetical protein
MIVIIARLKTLGSNPFLWKDRWRRLSVFCIMLFRADFPRAMQSLVGLGLRFVEASHSEKPHSVEILWIKNRTEEETLPLPT